MPASVRAAVRALSCALWGHAVDNRTAPVPAPAERRCRCGTSYLPADGRTTRIRHTLSCFLRRHTYVRLADRDGVHEYVCTRCGHPLLFSRDADPFADQPIFGKKVRYACGLLGHRVRRVTMREGLSEYACHCGHSFLLRTPDAATIRHPLICVLTAHRVRFLTAREGYAEYICDDCGHPFCFR